MIKLNVMFSLPYRTIFFAVLLFASICVGTTFRFVNISPFKFYPDAYQSLVVAKNILDYHSVLGRLGPDGMLYPEFVMWTHPGYPLLIIAASLFTKDVVIAAQAVAFLSGIAAIPLAYFLIRQIFHSRLYAICAAILVAFSFNHTVWGGFIMTETSGILCMLLFLFSLFSGITKKDQLANLLDFFTGILFAAAVITRYEYVIILFPVAFFFLTHEPPFYRRLITIFSAFFLTITIIFSQLFPVSNAIQAVVLQRIDLLEQGGFIGIIFLIFMFALWRWPIQLHRVLGTYLTGLILVIVWVCSLSIVVQLAFPQLTFLRKDLSFLRSFSSHDILISIFFPIGMTILLKNAKLRAYAIFVFLVCVSLLFFYHKINPEMERYMTHSIPFLIIPVSIGFGGTIKKTAQLLAKTARVDKTIGILFVIFIVSLLFLQALLTYNGIHFWRDHSWFQESYEEKAAGMVKPFIQGHDTLLITSFPEAYYFFTTASTYGVSDTYPFVFIDKQYVHRHLLVVLDMGMRDLFPHFASVVQHAMGKDIVSEFLVGERYHFAYISEKETHPVGIYKTTLDELEHAIQASHQEK